MAKPEAQLFSSGDVARRVDLPRWRLLYLVERGDLPGPTFAVPGRRLFTERDIQMIAEALAQRRALAGQ